MSELLRTIIFILIEFFSLIDNKHLILSLYVIRMTSCSIIEDYFLV